MRCIYCLPENPFGSHEARPPAQMIGPAKTWMQQQKWPKKGCLEDLWIQEKVLGSMRQGTRHTAARVM